MIFPPSKPALCQGACCLLFALLFATALSIPGAAGEKERPLPEFSQSLAESVLVNWPFPALTLTPLEGGDRIVASEPGGRIALISPLDGTSHLLAIPGGTEQLVAAAKSRLLLRSAGEWTLLETDSGKRHPRREQLQQGQVLGAGKGLVLLDRGSTLALVDSEQGELLGETDKGENTPGPAWFSETEVILPLGKRLLFFHRRERTWRKCPLPEHVTSAILVRDQDLYVGLAPRTLASLDRRDGRVRWRRDLPQPLLQAPMAVGDWIAVFPEDHNLYFYKTRGTLHWWTPLLSLPRFPPLSTAENVVLASHDQKLHLFDAKRRQTTTWTPSAPLAAPPVFVGTSLILPIKGEVESRICRLSNRITVDVTLAPAAPLEVGRGATITLTPVNLERPELAFSVLSADGTVWLERRLNRGATPTVAWIPPAAGEYRLRIVVTGNDRVAEIIHPVQVVDRQAQQDQLHYWLQQNVPR